MSVQLGRAERYYILAVAGSHADIAVVALTGTEAGTVAAPETAHDLTGTGADMVAATVASVAQTGNVDAAAAADTQTETGAVAESDFFVARRTGTGTETWTVDATAAADALTGSGS